MAHFLVTGGAGFIGSNLVDRLISDGHQVTVWDNYSTGLKENENKKATYYSVNVCYPVPKSKVQKYDAIFHLAAEARIQPSFKQPLLTHHTNITGMINVLELARHQKTRVVYAGSSSVYHDMYANPYSFTKQISEHYCTLYNRIFNVPVAIARFFNVYGPRQIESGQYATVLGIFERQKREGEELTVTGDGEQRRDFTHVDDIVEGLIAMSKDNWNADVFNLGTGINYSINEVAQMFDQPIKYIPARPGEARDTCACISYTNEKLGWKPTRDLKEYVDALLSNESMRCCTAC